MSFLIHQIKEQKILEAEVNFDDFIKENEISEDAMIQTLIFSKEVFSEQTEVREYLKAIYCEYNPKINELEDKFEVHMFSMTQLNSMSEVKIELRRGVTAIAYDLIPVINMEEIQFNDKGIKSFVSKFDSIDFSNGLPHVIEVVKVATGFHPRYGQIEVTQEHLESFVKNFDSKVTVIDLAVNEDHEKKEAFGWYKDVWLSHDKQTLYGSIEWNTKGISALSEKDYRYFSPEFNFNYKGELDGVEYGATLVGGALTNYPFLKMDAIIELNNKPQTVKESKMETIDLNTHNKQVVDLNGKINSIQVDLNAKVSENTILTAKVKELEDTINLNTKKQAHQKLFDQGLITAAQLDVMDNGGTLLDVIALNAKTNNNPAGGSGSSSETATATVAEEKAAASMGLSVEEYNATNL